VKILDAQLANDVLATTTLLAAAQAVGIDNILFAIDYPYESSALAVEFLHFFGSRASSGSSPDNSQ